LRTVHQTKNNQISVSFQHNKTNRLAEISRLLLVS
jgi:hypothetical protein